LDDGGTYRSSKGQRWLWRNWLSFWDDVSTDAEKYDADVWTAFNGDMVDVNGRHMQSQTISLNEADVFNMALDTIKPALDISDRIFVIRGTAAHVKSSGMMEEKLAADIGAVKDGDKSSWWELLLEVEGVQFLITHHGPQGRLYWTGGNALNKRATEIELIYKTRCPQVAIQSHNHKFDTSSDSYEVKVFAQPAWQLKTEFIRRIGRIGPADVGGMFFVCKDGEYREKVLRYKPDLPRPLRLK
jgi:hypothetical protein